MPSPRGATRSSGMYLVDVFHSGRAQIPFFFPAMLLVQEPPQVVLMHSQEGGFLVKPLWFQKASLFVISSQVGMSCDYLVALKWDSLG